MDPVRLDVTDEADDVRRLLELAVSDTRDSRAPVEEIVRRRERDRRTARIRTGAVLAAAAATVAVAVLPGSPLLRAEPEIVPAAPEIPAAMGNFGIGGVSVGSPEGWTMLKQGAPCVSPRTVAMNEGSEYGTPYGTEQADCGQGPAAVLATKENGSWLDSRNAGGAAGGPVLLDGAAVWLADNPAGVPDTDPTGRTEVVVPYGPADVVLVGTASQRQAMLDGLVTITAPAQPPVFAADPDTRASFAQPRAAGLEAHLSEEGAATWIAALQDAERVPPAERCIPAPDDVRVYDFASRPTPAEEGRPLQADVTSFVVDATGTCRTVLSSTGAVLRLPPGLLS